MAPGAVVGSPATRRTCGTVPGPVGTLRAKYNGGPTMTMLSYVFSAPVRPVTRWFRALVDAVRTPARRRQRRRDIEASVRLAGRLAAAGRHADAQALRVLMVRAVRLP